jgi:hypothetical protein
MYEVIFKLKPGVTDAQLAEMRTAGEAMVGQIPGLTNSSHNIGLSVG